MSDALDNKLRDIFRTVLKMSADSDPSLCARGETEAWDSLAHVMLISGVENEFEVQIDIETALELRTLEDFRALLHQPKSRGSV